MYLVSEIQWQLCSLDTAAAFRAKGKDSEGKEFLTFFAHFLFLWLTKRKTIHSSLQQMDLPGVFTYLFGLNIPFSFRTTSPSWGP